MKNLAPRTVLAYRRTTTPEKRFSSVREGAFDEP